MTDDVTPHIGGAALRAVQIGHGALDTLERQTCAQWLAQLAGVGSGNISRFYRFLAFGRILAHGRLLVAMRAGLLGRTDFFLPGHELPDRTHH